MSESPAWLDRFAARGMFPVGGRAFPASPGVECGPISRRMPAKLLPAAFRPPACWLVPLRVECSGNRSAIDRKRIGRSGRERRPVFYTLCRYHRELAPFVDHLTDGGRLRISLTRLGPGKMDTLNVGDAVKYVADAVADILAIDDGDGRLEWVLNSERAAGYGVRVELRFA